VVFVIVSSMRLKLLLRLRDFSWLLPYAALEHALRVAQLTKQLEECCATYEKLAFSESAAAAASSDEPE
jgi:hypothetical protein